MAIVAELSWDDSANGTFPDTSHAHRLRHALVQAASTMDHAPYNTPPEKLQKAIDLVLADKVTVHQDGTYTVIGSHPYEVTDRCACYQGQHGTSKWCKHLVAIELWKRTQERLSGTNGRSNGTPPTPRNGTGHQPTPATWVEQAKAHPVLTTATPTISPQFITQLHGKDFVQYAGLLALAHERGLTSLTASFISVTADLALAEATAEFQDGRTFQECADATPSNVHPKVKPHFARMALTRAKARALRDALNISMCAVEELEG